MKSLKVFVKSRFFPARVFGNFPRTCVSDEAPGGWAGGCVCVSLGFFPFFFPSGPPKNIYQQLPCRISPWPPAYWLRAPVMLAQIPQKGAQINGPGTNWACGAMFFHRNGPEWLGKALGVLFGGLGGQGGQQLK